MMKVCPHCKAAIDAGHQHRARFCPECGHELENIEIRDSDGLLDAGAIRVADGTQADQEDQRKHMSAQQQEASPTVKAGPDEYEQAFQKGQDLISIYLDNGELTKWSYVSLDEYCHSITFPHREPYPSTEKIREAYSNYKHAAKNGDPLYNYAAAAIGLELLWAPGGTYNNSARVDEVVPFLYKAAMGGITYAKHMYFAVTYLGKADYYPNAEKANADFLYEAAQEGNSDSEALWGSLLWDGKVAPRDDMSILQWLEKAAEDGSVSGHQLAALYCYNNGQYNNAVQHAFASGNGILSKYVLADSYRLGRGVEKDLAKALGYYNAIKGTYGATHYYCYGMADILLSEGVTFKPDEGIQYMRQSKDLGRDVSDLEMRCVELGLMDASELSGAGPAPDGTAPPAERPDDSTPFDLEAELESIVGLDEVKDMLRELQTSLAQSKKREERGLAVRRNDSLNLVFLGNPGTGKTTMGRLVARMLKEMGYLKGGQLVEVSRSDLVADVIGGTEKNTRAKFEEALGGVLFVDEAYALDGGDKKDFGRTAVDELVKCIGDHPGEVVVILAGYEKDMEAFFRHVNAGLKSRFPRNYWVNFPDYSMKQLALISEKMLMKSGWVLPAETIAALPEQLGLYMKQTRAAGDARMAGHFVTAVGRRQDQRSARENLDGDDLVTILPEDLEVAEELGDIEAFDLDAEFADLIGMKSVKAQLHALEASIKMEQLYKERGVESGDVVAPHMVFTGNPGTGKTTVARMMAKMLAQLGVIDSARVVDVKREDLVAGYEGQTGDKAMERFNEAIGGVLFVDEAYRLGRGGEYDFGREAAEALMQFAEDNRGKVVVILAGYQKELDDFFEKVNPGMKSRFNNTIDFPDYTPDELVQITCIHCRPSVPTDEAKDAMRAVFEKASQRKDFGNGRYARNVADRANENKKLRHFGIIESGGTLADEDLLTIEAEDIEEV